jgi:hypothetical protein
MRRHTTQGIQVLRRASEFLVDNTATGRLGPIDKQVKELSACLGNLIRHGGTQDDATRASREATRRAREAATALRREAMHPIARLAVLLFPRGSSERSYDSLIAAAAGFAGRAAEHKAKFIEAGLSEDFVERLQATAGELRKALDEKAKNYGRRIAATEGAEVEYARGRKIVRYLDTMVTPIWEVTPARLKEWKGLSRFARQAVPDETASEPPPVGGPKDKAA